MAIGTNAAVEFFGTQDDLASSSALVASAGFSIATDLATWVNDDDAPQASIILEVTMNVAAADNSVCNMYFRALNVEGANDDSIPEAEYRHNWVASFPVLNGITTIQRSTQRVSLPNFETSSEWEVYIENQTGQTIDAGWTVFVTPITIGPHA